MSAEHVSLSELEDLGIIKEADDDGFYWNALKTTPVRYNTDASVLQNIWQHLHSLKDNAHDKMQRSYATDRYLANTNPALGWQRTHQALSGVDPVVSNPTDKLINKLTGFQ